MRALKAAITICVVWGAMLAVYVYFLAQPQLLEFGVFYIFSCFVIIGASVNIRKIHEVSERDKQLNPTPVTEGPTNQRSKESGITHDEDQLIDVEVHGTAKIAISHLRDFKLMKMRFADLAQVEKAIQKEADESPIERGPFEEATV